MQRLNQEVLHSTLRGVPKIVVLFFWGAYDSVTRSLKKWEGFTFRNP